MFEKISIEVDLNTSASLKPDCMKILFILLLVWKELAFAHKATRAAPLSQHDTQPWQSMHVLKREFFAMTFYGDEYFHDILQEELFCQ